MLSSIARAMFPSISPFISMIMESEKSANKNQGKMICLFFIIIINNNNSEFLARSKIKTKLKQQFLYDIWQ